MNKEEDKGGGRTIASIDVGIRNLSFIKAVVGPHNGIVKIDSWKVLDLCPPTSPDLFCVKCAEGIKGKKGRSVKAAFQHPMCDDATYCVVHSRQEKFGFFPPNAVALKAAKKAAMLAASAEFMDDGINELSGEEEEEEEEEEEVMMMEDEVGSDDASFPIILLGKKRRKPEEEEKEKVQNKSPMETSISGRLSVTKSALTAMSLPELRQFAARHPGFSDMKLLSVHDTKAKSVAAMAAHMQSRTWRSCRRGKGGKGESATKVSVVVAGMRFAAIAKETGLFQGVDELIIENQLGFVAARMKSLQDVISCLAVFAGVPKVRAVSAATKLRGIDLDEYYAIKELEEEKEEEYEEEQQVDEDGSGGKVAVNDDSERARKIAALTRVKYRSHKAVGIAQTRAWLAANPNLSKDWTAVFEATKKKDDLADSLLQLLGQLS